MKGVSISRAAVSSGPRRRGFYLFVDVVAVHFEISQVSGVTAAVVKMSVPSSLMKQPPIQSTAGAVLVRNEKGEISMEKVKVKRYVSGKRPDYVPMESSDEEDEEFQFIKKAKEQEAEPQEQEEDSSSDPRLRRLQNRISEDVEERLARHWKIAEPEVVGESDSEVEGDPWRMEREDSSEEEEQEIDEGEIERRRGMMRQRAQERKNEELEVMEVEDEGRSGEESESESAYEGYIDSEDETEPRLKPVFLRKKDRVTVQEHEAEALKQKELEQEAKHKAEERRKYTLKIVDEETKKERSLAALDALNTNDENDEEEYEAWEVRELKRIERDREDREALEKEKAETERMRNLTEEERRAELRANGKVISNKPVKGKYKFLQKYYHRGAFFMDEDEEVYKRDFSAPTLEDHFNKTILPKVMQVKNFGRSGRTKYTHLVDQDTTSFDSAWGQESAQNTKVFKQKAAGVRDVFERPSAKKRKTT
ncbi:microfibrillar-associated protein 1-like [Cervus elaphus]|uniref:microfibrillar-associated protein 1-like n=1 Tax=Cervus elaphus TaxID=9860 RepID=UPI001CC3227B|nr:microfibrillar-associated protein 1-like [Cervus elaphus]